MRPTTDRVREALFNILATRVPGCRFLDLYAGTGAVGLEAVSRGARDVVFVERDRQAAAVLRRNLEDTGVGRGATLRAGDVEAVIGSLGREGRVFDLVYVDPPYKGTLVNKTVLTLARSGVVEPDGWIIVESSQRNPPAERIGGFEVWRRERYGEIVLSFYRRAGE